MMNAQRRRKFVTLLRREMQEYRNSLLITPVAVAGIMVFFMFISIAVANRITATGESIMDVLMDEHAAGMNITITLDEDAPEPEYVVRDEPAEADEWNFSREWSFRSKLPERPAADSPRDVAAKIESGERSLNPVLNVLHALFLLLLLVTSVNYLLGTLHQDRRDRSVLFWKSMPVSEWEEVATRMAVVCLVAPAVYLAVSMMSQLVSVLLGMVMAWRMDMDPWAVVMGNVDFIGLFRGQLGVMLIWVLWSAPFYAWCLFSSAAARRSPLMFALAFPLGVIIVEKVFLGSDYAASAFGNHIPHPGEEETSQLGFQFYEPNWLSLDYLGMLLGLVVTGALLSATVWFRKHRFEL